MAKPGKTTAVATGAVGVAIAGFAGHAAGWFHGAEEAGPSVRTVVQHSDSWTSALSTLKDFNRGDVTDRAVARATCTFANAYVSEQPDIETIKNGIWANLGRSPQSPDAYLYSALVTKATNVIYLAELNGGLANNYARMCVVPSGG